MGQISDFFHFALVMRINAMYRGKVGMSVWIVRNVDLFNYFLFLDAWLTIRVLIVFFMGQIAATVVSFHFHLDLANQTLFSILFLQRVSYSFTLQFQMIHHPLRHRHRHILRERLAHPSRNYWRIMLRVNNLFMAITKVSSTDDSFLSYKICCLYSSLQCSSIPWYLSSRSGKVFKQERKERLV